jgi:gas vesicle protein GvpA/GvpJ/GvpM family
MTAVMTSDVLSPEPAVATSLVDLLDRLLGVGVVLAGDLTISLAGVDLVTIKLRALISTVREADE